MVELAAKECLSFLERESFNSALLLIVICVFFVCSANCEDLVTPESHRVYVIFTFSEGDLNGLYVVWQPGFHVAIS